MLNLIISSIVAFTLIKVADFTIFQGLVITYLCAIFLNTSNLTIFGIRVSRDN